MQHLEEGEIHAWLDGALSEAEGARIEQHAATCKECAAMVADARGLIAGAARIVSALDHVPSGVIPKSGATATASRPLWRVLRLTPFRAAMAASLVVAAGSLIVVQRKDAKLMVPTAENIAMPMTVSAPTPVVAAVVEDKAAERIDAAAANEARQSEPARSRRLQESVSKTTLALKDTALLMKPAAPDAAPAPKVASADDQRATKERDSILSGKVAVTAAPASAIGAGGRGGQAQAQAQQGQTGAQGQIASREPARDSARASADIAFRRALPPAVQRAEASFAPTVLPSFIGCYQVADTARWPRTFPSRFVLAVDSASGRVQFPMKALAAAGRPDTATIGSWRTLTPTSIRVDLNTVAFPAWFTLVRNASGNTATISNSTSTSAGVVRLDCPR